jgi:hypothetical protein
MSTRKIRLLLPDANTILDFPAGPVETCFNQSSSAGLPHESRISIALSQDTSPAESNARCKNGEKNGPFPSENAHAKRQLWAYSGLALGNPHQRRTPLRPRGTAALQETDLHSRFEQGSQPRSERSTQGCRYPGQCTARTVSGFLPKIADQRHQADDGASHARTQDCSHYADSVEEGRKLRR